MYLVICNVHISVFAFKCVSMHVCVYLAQLPKTEGLITVKPSSFYRETLCKKKNTKQAK